MGKRTIKLISCIVAAVLLFTVPVSPVNADSSGICFTAVNDEVLPISMMPVFIDGMAYVRCDVFKNLGISYIYFTPENVLMLYSGATQIYFDLNDGTCYDVNDLSYAISAKNIGGIVYVPARTGILFGLKDKIHTGTGNGDLLRITNGKQSLSDSFFLSGASSLILEMYIEYTGATNAPNPQTPGANDPSEVDGTAVYLSFVGMPSSDTLDILKSYSVFAAFFITAEEAKNDPDMVRRIIGEGNTIGVYCSEDPVTECGDTAAAIQEAAFYMPTIMTSPNTDDDENMQYAAENGFAYYSPTLTFTTDLNSAYAVTARLPKNLPRCDLSLLSSENTDAVLPDILYYLSANLYNTVLLLETSC